MARAMSLERVGDLQLVRDDGFERRNLIATRVAFAVLTVMVVAAVLGVFGGTGPLAETTVRSGQAAVGFDRFVRLGAPTELHVTLAGDQADMSNVAVKSAYLSGFTVEGITPQPDSQTARPDRLVYTFDADAPATVTLALTPREAGIQRGVVDTGSGDPVEFTQIVYP